MGDFFDRIVGLHERAEEILVAAHYCDARAFGQLDRPHPRIGGGAVHLHPVLTTQGKQSLLFPFMEAHPF